MLLVTAEAKQEVKEDPAGPFVAQVFKVWIEPKSNIKYSFFRVHSGTAGADLAVQVDEERKGQRLGHILKFKGSEHEDVDAAVAGDLCAVAKLDLHIGQMLHAGTPGKIDLPKFPSPMNSVAVEPKARGDEVKINEALGKLADMDPCFKTGRDAADGRDDHQRHGRSAPARDAQPDEPVQQGRGQHQAAEDPL